MCVVLKDLKMFAVEVPENWIEFDGLLILCPHCGFGKSPEFGDPLAFPTSRLSDFVNDNLDSRTVYEGDRGFLHRLDVQSSGLVGEGNS